MRRRRGEDEKLNAGERCGEITRRVAAAARLVVNFRLRELMAFVLMIIYRPIGACGQIKRSGVSRACGMRDHQVKPFDTWRH